jgi:CRISPR-associated protein Cas1
MPLKGRLGLEEARIPHRDRHGLLWLDRGQLTVEDGCLRFVTAGGTLAPGDYQIPHQALSIILLGPGSTISHDALRLISRHGVAMAAVGDDGVRCYTAPPLGPDRSDVARRQAAAWAGKSERLQIARRMYAWRLGEVLPARTIEIMRGIEGARVKELYKIIAQRFGVEWRGRHYDRADPNAADPPNQAINHASTAVQAAAAIAVAALSALPQLGFIHEDSDQAFVLDIADLFRETVTLPIAFAAVKESDKTGQLLERCVRRGAGRAFRQQEVIPSMIDRIKNLFEVSD